MKKETIFERPLVGTHGPWDLEPDVIKWVDEATGYPCVVNRASHIWHLCGYVCVPAGHRLHGSGYEEAYSNGYDGDGGHGGITFADDHTPAPGDDDDGWWFGFDCAHYMDLLPWRGIDLPGTYRDVEYVKLCCRRFARELADLADVGEK